MIRRPTILIADDHAIVAEALATSLERWYRVSGIVQSIEEIPSAIRKHEPAVVLIDLSFGEQSSLRHLPQFTRDFPSVAFVVLTAHPETVLVDNAIRSGARGYVIKRSAPAELRVAIEEALEGRIYVTPMVKAPPEGSEAIPKGLLPDRDPIRLSERQYRILELLQEGCSVREVADAMSLSTSTVDYHLNSVRAKVGIVKLSQVIRWFIGWQASGGVAGNSADDDENSSPTR